jgi:hypothetical protein
MTAANWRRMLERDLGSEAARAAAVSQRLRLMYDDAKQERDNRQVEVRCLGFRPSTAQPL